MFRYNATLGHKVNHSFEPNAEFVLFPVHPVLGTIMSLAALTDIHPAEEVRKDNVNKTKTINDVIFLGLFFRRKAKKQGVMRFRSYYCCNLFLYYLLCILMNAF